jgi:subtilisin family serine protease
MTADIYYPARYVETIAIGSIDQNFNRSKFSNTGANLDFLAPGGRILSTIPSHTYGIMSGTSMACPFAVGVGALLLSYVNHHETEIKLKCSMDYINIIKKHTLHISDPKLTGLNFWEGFGILNPAAMIGDLENQHYTHKI